MHQRDMKVTVDPQDMLTSMSRPHQIAFEDVGRDTLPSHIGQGQKRQSSMITDGQQQLCPQQRYAKRPKHPGMGTFDSTLRQLPLQQRRITKPGSLPMMKLNLTDRTKITAETNCDAESSSSDESVTSADLREYREEMGDNEDETSVNSVVPVIVDKTACYTVFEARPPSSGTKTSAWPEVVLDASDLYVQTKLTYAILISRSEQEGLPQPDAGFRSDQNRRRLQALHGLRLSLRLNALQKQYDFFSSSQDLEREDLRRLAEFFGLSGAAHRSKARQLVCCLKQMSQEYRNLMVSFADRARRFIDVFSQAVLTVKDQWLNMSTYLHQYIHALFDEGFSASCVFPPFLSEDWSQIHVWARFRAAPLQSIDDDLRQWYFEHHRPHATIDAGLLDDNYQQTILPLKNEVLSFLSGWVGFGPRIARNFHDYCRVFIFLAWFGSIYVTEEDVTEIVTVCQAR